MQKKLLIAASSFIVLLTIANIGSSYCAVSLAKDLKVATNGVMKDMAGGNVKTEGIAPKVTLYEVSKGGRRLKSKRDIHRKLQDGQESDGTNFVIHGIVDGQGVSDILDGGLTQFLTNSGMQSCDVTGFQKRSENVYILFSSCGIGSLILTQESQSKEEETQGVRRLSSGSTNTGIVYFDSNYNPFDNDNDPCNSREGQYEVDEYGGPDFKVVVSADCKSLWLCYRNPAEAYPSFSLYGNICYYDNLVLDPDATYTFNDWVMGMSSSCIEASTVSTGQCAANDVAPSSPPPVQTPPPTPLPTPAPTPAPTPPPTGLQFSLEYSHACALFSSIVKCVGMNGFGQLGTSDSGNINNEVRTPVNMGLPYGMNPTQVVTGGEHTCVLFKENGSVYCVGNNNRGQLGNTSPGKKSSALVPVMKGTSSISGVKEIAAGYSHTCAIFQNPSTPFYCWGNNNRKELAFNDDEVPSAAVKFMALSHERTCIVEGTNTVKCTDSDNITLTVTFDAWDEIKKLTTGYDHFCALLDNDTAKCFGSNRHYQLGNGLVRDEWGTAQSVLGPDGREPLQNISDINAGYFSTCLVANGMPMCFGLNDNHQLGFSSNGNFDYPTQVPASLLPAVGENKQVISVHVGAYTGHAVFSDNTVYAWGSNDYGTLGDGSSYSVIYENAGEDGYRSEAVEMQFNFPSPTPAPTPEPTEQR